MKLLLDTHIMLWSLLEPERLPVAVATALENDSNELWVSPISTWEIHVLAEKGRVQLDTRPDLWLREVFNTIPFKEAPLNHEVALRSRTIEYDYEDPADRFLIATTIVYDLTLVTADRRISAANPCPIFQGH